MRLLDAEWGSGEASVWLERRRTGRDERDELGEPGRAGLGRTLNAR